MNTTQRQCSYPKCERKVSAAAWEVEGYEATCDKCAERDHAEFVRTQAYRELLAKLKQQAAAQAPYFSDRLLTKIEQISAILQDNAK